MKYLRRWMTKCTKISKQNPKIEYTTTLIYEKDIIV